VFDSSTTNAAPRSFFARGAIARGMHVRQFIGIVCAFWLYVTISDVVYAHSMRTGIAHLAGVEMLFVSWNVRVLQHVFLLPVLMVSFWAALIIEWRPLWLALPLQLVLAAAFAAIGYPAMLLAQALIDGGHLPDQRLAAHLGDAWRDPALLSLWLASFVAFLPAYGFGLALVRGAILYTRYRDTELRIADLERKWSAARLAALRMQLSPHTLFNLLHTIRGNIEWEPRVAQSMVVQLADLLRRLLSAGERDFSRVTDELQFCGMYLELQQRRFPDRMSFTLPDPAQVPAAWVPSLILQPLVENAVVHGLSGHHGAVAISVDARLAADTLHLRVVNTIGPGRGAAGEGIGLKNVRERLAVQFGARGTLRTGSADGAWTVDIAMPAIQGAANGAAFAGELRA
jgi:hypothetical protein